MKEQEAITCLKHGNIAGLETIVHLYQIKAVRTAYLITHDLDLAEEVVQEAFLRVYERIGQFDSRRPFAPWFLRIVVNAAVKAARRSQRYLPIETLNRNERTALDERLFDIDPEMDDQVAARILRDRVWEALTNLTPKQRAAIVLRYYLGMDDVEMANELNVALGTVRWRLHAARERLLVLLKLSS